MTSTAGLQASSPASDDALSKVSSSGVIPLSRRLVAALVVMLLPLVAVGALGIATFRSSVGALESLGDDIIHEQGAIEQVRQLLMEVDDAVEDYFERTNDVGRNEFIAVGGQINAQFRALENLKTEVERGLAAEARSLWRTAFSIALKARSLEARGNRDPLDPFHDALDQAGARVADLHALNGEEVEEEITSMAEQEALQLLTAFGILGGSLIGAIVLARRLGRSITRPLHALEQAAACFGLDDLSHRIAVEGNDELAQVSRAFNAMAETLQASRDELSLQARHDPLTGLPNRTLFIERLDHAIARGNRSGDPMSLLYIDLDGFKAVNDSLGHEAGDDLLMAVSALLTESLREEDTAARVGGDEFAILLEDADAPGAVEAAQRLIRSFAANRFPAAGGLPVGVSIGITIREDGEDVNELLRQADAAMYAAKGAGKGRWSMFGPDLEADATGTRELRSELTRAIERREFVINYQPIVDIKSGGIHAVEALVRWDHPERGLIDPAEFLQEAEETGQILFIDKWVLEEACRQVRAWQRNIPGAESLSVNVNLSGRQLHHPGLTEEVREVLQSSGLPSTNLTLELTETTLVRDTETAARELRRLKKVGVKLALDDFGTGYSSLTYLRRFPIDLIKIDRSFVTGCVTDRHRSELMAALVQLGGRLGLRVVAEGIEDASDVVFVNSVNCDLGQEYYFARPLSADKMQRLLRSGGSWTASSGTRSIVRV